ncbi:flagellar motor protein MotB [Candidatus Magnetomorum sp. HK-1]|nr:flagellar motor protein MotB [Candidatus Magnetomorum sp. HK-1]
MKTDRLLIRSAIIFGVMIFFLSGCSISKRNIITPFVPQNVNFLIETNEYSAKIDAFMVILDLSISMTESYNSRNKYKKAVDIVSRMNQTLPDIPLIGTLRTIGNYDCALCRTTTSIYGPKPYNQRDFDFALRKIKGANGESPLDLAIEAATQDLRQVTTGRLALIIVSDFKELQKSSIKAAQEMQEILGDRLAIFNIMVGNDLEGKNLMQGIAQAGKYGFSVSAESITSPEKMADFVKMVFLERALDSDHDGVFNTHDECPNTPRGILVNDYGCPKDTDADGVYDSNDQCPTTPKGIVVDEMGCPYDRDQDGVKDYLDKCLETPLGAKVNINGCWIISPHFLNQCCPAGRPYMDEAFMIIQNNPNMCVDIQVSTNALETEQSNKELGKFWGQNIKSYLMTKGLSDDRIWVTGQSIEKAKGSPESLTPITQVIFNPASCTRDRDGDGVYDAVDRCPDTPKGLKVDAYGCPHMKKKQVSIKLDIKFDSNKSDVKSQFFHHIQKVAQFMKTYPYSKAIIEAHTDSSGDAAYNLKLSQKRADNVRKYIINNFQIPQERIIAIGYGETRPIADNKTLKGKKKNRRATAIIKAGEKK